MNSLLSVIGGVAHSVTQSAAGLPAGQFPIFLNSLIPGFALMPGGSQGPFCLGSAIGRYIQPGQILHSGNAGTVTLPLDLTQTPTPMGNVAIAAGETWNC